MIIIILIIILLVGIVLILADKKDDGEIMLLTEMQLEHEKFVEAQKETARAGVFFYEDDGEPAPELPGWDRWVELTGCDFIPATVSLSEYLQTVGEQ